MTSTLKNRDQLFSQDDYKNMSIYKLFDNRTPVSYTNNQENTSVGDIASVLLSHSPLRSSRGFLNESFFQQLLFFVRNAQQTYNVYNVREF